MSKLFNGGASFGFSLNFNSAVPVDTRFVVSSLNDLKNPETWVSGTYDSEEDSNNVYTVYPGMFVSVLSEKTLYQYSSETVNGANISNINTWTKLASSNSTGDQVSVEDVTGSEQYEDVF